MTMMTPPPPLDQEDDEMLVPHTDFAVEGPQPMEVPQSESASTAENQAAEDPQTLRFTWTIENFSRLNVKKHYSDVFTVGGYKWRVLIFPKGNNVDNLSMYLDVADSTTLPYGWSRYAQFSLAIVNQVHNKYTIRKDTQHQFNARESDWGFTSFMPLSELYDPSRGYLVSDTCVVEAEVAVRRVVDYWAYDSKKETGYVGLKNQGATCYMNSLLQTLYHIPYFRKAVYHMPTTENDMPSGSIPLALQSLFYKLQYSDSSVATKELTKSFGWDTYDSFMQHDVQELNRVLCEKLEDKMKGTVVEGTIQQLFEGHHMNYIECINVDYESTKKESFYDLQLDVKGCRDVYASFDKYVEVERLEGDNKYHAEQHGLQDAKKCVLFIDFPPVLQLQLKRFEYGDTMVKINDRYEFPLQLDLDRENGKYLSPNADRKVRNLYTLHSVLVHSGGEHGGHYHAFIRPTLLDQWFKFDDERVTKEDMKWALEEQYGGEEELPQTNPGFNNTPFKFTKYSNAYMLVYIRESDKEKIMDEKDIAEHHRIRLKREQEEKEHKKEEKAEAHLYTRIKIPEEEKNLGSQDRLIHVYHFTKDTTQNQMQVQNFGEPFFLIIHEGETLSEVRVRIQKKLQVPDDEFSKCLCENSVMASHNDDVDIDIEVLGSNTPVFNDNAFNSTTGDCSIATSVKPKKGGYPLKSHVWQHFTRDPKTKGDDLMAICKYCYGRYKAASKSGTSTLSRHLTRCTAYSVKDKSQKVLTFGSVKKEDGNEGVRAGLVPYSFNMEHAQRELAIMIVMLELPFSIVDRAPFRRFVKCINPRFQFISCTTVRREFLKIYHLEKAKLKSFLSTSCKHISLTSDLWTSNQTLGYLSVTAHFVDNNWKLHKKILSFCMVPAPHTGVIIANMIERSLMEYDIKKICTITLDNATNNKSAVDNLVETLSRKGILLQRGKFFHIKCAAHVVNLIVQDGLSEIKSSVEAIRTCVEYVRSSQSHKQEFESCVLQENISSSKGLCLDVCTRWNSTYLMLASALPYESAFVRMKTRDPIYAKDVAPTFDDWRKAETISKLLKVFYNATKVLSGTKYITANLVFHEVYEIQAHLLEMLKSDDSCISSMANKMQQKFDKYWKKCNILFAIALVLDPRYKLEYVEFMYHELYSYSDADEYTQVLRKEMVALFNEYTSFSSSLQKQVITSTSTDSKKEQLRKSFLRKGAGKNNVDLKTELEQYYEEKICPDDPNLDILSWWKVNSSKFPILSTMARDILAIQVSTVASESAFNTGSRVINQYRSSLSPGVIQALVCTQDWLRDAITDDVVEGEPEVYDHEDDTDRIESGVTEVEESEI